MTTTPSYPEYQALLDAAKEAAHCDGGFVHPVKAVACSAIPRSWDWRVSVLGHSQPKTPVEMHMLLIADQRGIEPPLPEWLAQRRAEDNARAVDRARRIEEWQTSCKREWHTIVDELPVPVRVSYNYSGRHHYERHVSGADHILAGEPVRSGRFYRPGGYTNASVFCAYRGKQLDCAYDRARAYADEGIPTCKACIDRAVNLTGVAAPTLRAGYYRVPGLR